MGKPEKNTFSRAEKFLKSHRVLTVTTISPDKLPDAASVFYIVDDDLNFYFMTRVESRKYRNIKRQSKVAGVVTDEKEMKTVQFSGIAKPMDELDEEHVINKLWAVDYKKNEHWPGPAVRLFESGHTIELAAIKVQPKEMTYAHFQQKDNGRYRPFFETII